MPPAAVHTGSGGCPVNEQRAGRVPALRARGTLPPFFFQIVTGVWVPADHGQAAGTPLKGVGRARRSARRRHFPPPQFGSTMLTMRAIVVGIIFSVAVVGFPLAAFCGRLPGEVASWMVFPNRAGWSNRYPAGWKIGSCKSCLDPTAPNVFVDFFPPADNGSDGWVMIEHLQDKPSEISVDAWFNDIKMKANLNPEIDEEKFTLKVKAADTVTLSGNLQACFASL